MGMVAQGSHRARRRRARNGMVTQGSSSTRRRVREGMVARGSNKESAQGDGCARESKKKESVQGDGCARKYQREKESVCEGIVARVGRRRGKGVAGCNSGTAWVMLSDDPGTLGTFSCCVGGREFGQG